MAGVMVSASTGAMCSVLAKLTTLLVDEYNLPKGVKREFTFLKDELASTNGLMAKLAETEDLDPLVKGWMKQVREMTYDLEDSIDEFMVRSVDEGGAESAGFVRSTARRLRTIRSRHRIAGQIQELKARIVEASERRTRYKLDDVVTSGPRTVAIDPRLPPLYAKEDGSLVGLDGPREELIKWLTDDQHQLKAVTIVGFGGLGKTTLAHEVYRGLKGEFECRASVSVSRRPDMKKILPSILSQVRLQNDANIGQWDEVQLVNELREFLRHKRYLIIIDDIWSTEAWRTIKCALPENNLGSGILLTTRIFDVARICSRVGHIFALKPLSDSDSQELFFNRIFGSGDACPCHLNGVSDRILKRCGGVPLAIIAIASLLANKPRAQDQWEIVLNSIGSSLERNPTLRAMRRVLDTSYIDLPQHLKTCLLYISLFPEYYVIGRDQLVRRWMAEGFIATERGMSSQSVGECFFNELINRSLIQPVGTQYDGRVEACKVHDIILDFIISKSVEENFVTIYGNHDHMFGPQDNVRRLSLDWHDREGTFIQSEITTTHVRSLTIFGSNEEMPALAKFRALRVLDLEISGELGSHYLQGIGRLYLLKYLRLQTASVIELPKQIGKLQYLQTLDLTGARECRLPKSIVRLRRLIYLLVDNVKLPDGFGNMQGLEELSCIEVDSSNSTHYLQELGSLTTLRVIGLHWCISDTDADKKSCGDKLVSLLDKLGSSNLQSLYIKGRDGCSLDFLLDSTLSFSHLREFRMISNYYFPNVPKWMASLVNLNLLGINIDTVGEEVLQILGELPALLVLLLSANSTAPEQGFIIRNSGFHCLKKFDFTCWSMLPIMFEPRAMQNLEKLQLVFSAQAGECVHDGFRFGIEHLSSLRHLRVEINCKGARASEVEAAEDVIKKATIAHPKRPRLELQRHDEQCMVNDDVIRGGGRSTIRAGRAPPALAWFPDTPGGPLDPAGAREEDSLLEDELQLSRTDGASEKTWRRGAILGRTLRTDGPPDHP